MANELIKRQGFMDVYSKALDDAFADTDVKPRQRLLSAKIDFTIGETDCATVTFADPDGRVSKAIRNGFTKVGDNIIYTPWTVDIGYYNLPQAERTQLVGVPQLEAPDFPESGVPRTAVKVFDASVALEKNTSPGGDPANYPDATDPANGPLRLALNAVCSFYNISPDFGLVDELITKIDGESIIPRITEMKQLEADPQPVVATYNDVYGLSAHAPHFNRLTATEKDGYWLRRIAREITDMVRAPGVLPAASTIAKYFEDQLQGEVAVSDLEVVAGIRAGRLVFKFAHEFLLENGFDQGVPVVDWRCGNNLLLSFFPQVVAAKAQSGWLALIVNLFKRDKEADAVEEPPAVSSEMSPSEGVGDINSLITDKRYFFARTLPDGSGANTVEWLEFLRRQLATDITGRGKALGIPKLMAGQLIGLTGLGWGPQTEIDAEKTIEQQWGCYNRIYVTKSVTHNMDQSGVYTTEFEVSGCSSDGSHSVVIKDLLKRLKEGLNSKSAGGIWEALGII